MILIPPRCCDAYELNRIFNCRVLIISHQQPMIAAYSKLQTRLPCRKYKQYKYIPTPNSYPGLPVDAGLGFTMNLPRPPISFSDLMHHFPCGLLERPRAFCQCHVLLVLPVVVRLMPPRCSRTLTVKHALYSLKSAAHSSVVPFPRRYSEERVNYWLKVQREPSYFHCTTSRNMYHSA